MLSRRQTCGQARKQWNQHQAPRSMLAGNNKGTSADLLARASNGVCFSHLLHDMGVFWPSNVVQAMT